MLSFSLSFEWINHLNLILNWYKKIRVLEFCDWQYISRRIESVPDSCDKSFVRILQRGNSLMAGGTTNANRCQRSHDMAAKSHSRLFNNWSWHWLFPLITQSASCHKRFLLNSNFLLPRTYVLYSSDFSSEKLDTECFLRYVSTLHLRNDDYRDIIVESH